MAERQCDVIVIGAGTAGLHAYKTATARGADTVIIERGPGGSTCTRIGCMPSKLLIAAARVARTCAEAGCFGVETGPVAIDAATLWARVRRERDRFDQAIRDEYHAIPDDRRIHGSARFTGSDSVEVDDDRIVARQGIIIATGARPIVPDTLEAVRDLVHTHETIFELDHLPKAMAVLGAGPVGLELAQALARLGVAVTLFDPGKALAGLVDPETNAAATHALGQEVTLRLGVEAKAERADDGRAILSWEGGSTTVDLILAATGRPPELKELGLEATGLELDDHGTPLFDTQSRRCGDSAIFIAGDANAWRPVLHEAARGGRIAATVATGGDAPRPLPAFAITFTEPNLTEIGTAFDELPDDARIGCAKVADNGRATVDGVARGLVRLYADRDGVLLGASIAAPEGEHLGHLVALAIDQGMDAARFADQPWYHPTVEELLQMAARDIVGSEQVLV